MIGMRETVPLAAFLLVVIGFVLLGVAWVLDHLRGH